MEFKTARSHYNTFYMILLGIAIGVLVCSFTGRIHWYAVLILSVPMLLPYMFYRVYLSIDIAEEQLGEKHFMLCTSLTMERCFTR